MNKKNERRFWSDLLKCYENCEWILEKFGQTNILTKVFTF